MHNPRALLIPALLACCLGASACAHIPRWMGGSPDIHMRLDGEQSYEATVSVGHTLSFDVRDPKAAGYMFSGTYFEPALFRMGDIVRSEDASRLTYTFTALAVGEGDILIKIKLQKPGFQPEVFKRIHVTVTK
jgi:hypothetical protein